MKGAKLNMTMSLAQAICKCQNLTPQERNGRFMVSPSRPDTMRLPSCRLQQIGSNTFRPKCS